MDKIIKYLNAKDTIRFFAVDSTETTREALRIHSFSPTATAAVGRVMTAASVMAAQQKDASNITINIKGGGPIGTICVVAHPGVTLKACADYPQADVPPLHPGKLNVGGLVGCGRMSVIKDLRMKEPFVGQIEMVSGEIGEDIAQYYMKSEQQPSLVALGVLVNADGVVASGGLIAQLLPDCPEEDITQLEACAARLNNVSAQIAEKQDIDALAREVFEEMDLRRIEEIPLNYHCDCSRERIEGALIALGKKELAEMAQSNEDTEVSCHFCNTAYRFTPDEMLQLLNEAIRRKA